MERGSQRQPSCGCSGCAMRACANACIDSMPYFTNMECGEDIFFSTFLPLRVLAYMAKLTYLVVTSPTLVVGVIQQITLLLHSALSAWLPLLSPSVCSSDLVSLPSVGTSKQQPNSQFKHASKMFLHFLNRATHAPSPSPPLSHPPP